MLSGAQEPHDLRDKLNDANRKSFYQGKGSETDDHYRVQTEQAYESYSEPPNVDFDERIDLDHKKPYYDEYSATDDQYRIVSEKAYDSYSDTYHSNIESSATNEYRTQSEKVFDNYSDSRDYRSSGSGRNFDEEWRHLQEERRALKEEREDLEREWEAVDAYRASAHDRYHYSERDRDFEDQHYFSNPRPGYSKYGH